MASLSTNAQLYGRLALLRRRILFRYAASRIIFGTLAVLFLLAGLVLLNVALFLGLRNSLGDIGAVLVVAVVHLIVGSGALIATLREPNSPELEALGEAEAAAFEAFSSDTGGLAQSLSSVGDRLTRVGSNVSLGLAALSGLHSLMARATDKTDKPSSKS
jgi:hypothetical protein